MLEHFSSRRLGQRKAGAQEEPGGWDYSELETGEVRCLFWNSTYVGRSFFSSLSQADMNISSCAQIFTDLKFRFQKHPAKERHVGVSHIDVI